jgi:hypothetical protein
MNAQILKSMETENILMAASGLKEERNREQLLKCKEFLSEVMKTIQDSIFVVYSLVNMSYKQNCAL